MRVLILSRKEIANAFTGDSVQMRNTISCIRRLVDNVSHVYIDSFGCLFDERGKLLNESLISLCARHDVIHQLPRLEVSVHKTLQNVLTSRPVVVSTVFWSDVARLVVAWNNEIRGLWRVRAVLSTWRAGTKLFQDYSKGCNVFLPNSWAEGENVRKHFRLASHAIVMPVPNAIKLPDFGLEGLARPAEIPFGEYVVCPAVFAPRKNQLGLIKALRNCDFPLVFMGNPLASSRHYWNECRRKATPRMFFLEHRDNSSKEFWSVLRYSRCACLPSDCETPGIALLEASVAGARPIITKNGGTQEYYGLSAEYLNPTSTSSIRDSITRGWMRGRLSKSESDYFRRYTWEWVAEQTVRAYQLAIERF